MQMSVAALVAPFVSWLLFLLVAALLYKLSVRLANGAVAGYWRSVAVLAVTSIVMGLVQWGLAAALGLGADSLEQVRNAEVSAAAMGSRALLAMLLAASAALLLLAAATRLAVRRPDGTSIGYGSALLASLLFMVLLVVSGIAIGVVASLLMASAWAAPAFPAEAAVAAGFSRG